VRSLLGSRSRLQDVPKIAQLVEARIHAWLDERCVEPRVQQIVIPGLWPRKKNTRGGEEEDVDEDEEAIADETESEGEPSSGTRGARGMRAVATDGGSLEARMATEGQKLLAAEGRGPPQSGREQSADEEGVKRRNPTVRKNLSTENMRIPGQFD
jgi:maintenance of mitochondrial morphology protein 1